MLSMGGVENSEDNIFLKEKEENTKAAKSALLCSLGQNDYSKLHGKALQLTVGHKGRTDVIKSAVVSSSQVYAHTYNHLATAQCTHPNHQCTAWAHLRALEFCVQGEQHMQ